MSVTYMTGHHFQKASRQELGLSSPVPRYVRRKDASSGLCTSFVGLEVVRELYKRPLESFNAQAALVRQKGHV